MSTEKAFIKFDPYMDECDVRHKQVKMVTTRTEQTCFCPVGKVHPIPVGTRARFEKALVEGAWQRYYTCIACCEYGLTFDHKAPQGCKGHHSDLCKRTDAALEAK
jgi:hypothetical protein